MSLQSTIEKQQLEKLRDKCKDKNIFTNMCAKVNEKFPESAFKIKEKVCTVDQIRNNLKCREWVTNEAQGKIDMTMIAFAKKYPTDPLSTCINSKIPCPNKFDSRCIQNAGYKTYDMLTTKCPDVLNCEQYVTLGPDSQSYAINVQQDCGGKNKTANVPKTEFPFKLILLILLPFILLIIAVIVSVLVYKKIFPTKTT